MSTTLDHLLDDLQSVRTYTCELLDHTDPGRWFEAPGGVTHLAWQVGHLAMAEYRLCLERIRGPKRSDERLISREMLRQFGKGSTPDPNPANHAPVAELRAVFDRVHEQILRELSALPESVLDEDVDPPHPRFNTKSGAIRWAAWHEAIHSGQIALLRRQLGAAPLR